MQHKYLVIWTIIEFCRVVNLPAVILGMHGTEVFSFQFWNVFDKKNVFLKIFQKTF